MSDVTMGLKCPQKKQVRMHNAYGCRFGCDRECHDIASTLMDPTPSVIPCDPPVPLQLPLIRLELPLELRGQMIMPSIVGSAAKPQVWQSESQEIERGKQTLGWSRLSDRTFGPSTTPAHRSHPHAGPRLA